jgi:hypothetical protein
MADTDIIPKLRHEIIAQAFMSALQPAARIAVPWSRVRGGWFSSFSTLDAAMTSSSQTRAYLSLARSFNAADFEGQIRVPLALIPRNT